MKTNQGTSVPNEPRADTSYVHWKFESTSKSCGAKKLFGTEKAVGLLSWLEEVEYVLYISKFPAESQVEFASSQPWENLKKLLREEYCPDNAIEKFKEEF
ncbi:hypothetical protein Tco_0602221 [Tanacetum coccineum]